MTDLERIKKDVVEMDSRANVCWYDTKVLTKAVRLILEELTADRKTEPNNSEKPNSSTISKMEQVKQRSCDTCKNRDIEGWKNPRLGCTGFTFYEPKDEPQTERPTQCSKCKVWHRCFKEKPPYNMIKSRCPLDEAQTGRPWGMYIDEHPMYE